MPLTGPGGTPEPGASTPAPVAAAAAAAAGPTLFTQPPFDPRIQRLIDPASGEPLALQRGYMVWDKPYPPGYGAAAVVKFLYNPSTVNTTYVLQDSNAQSALNYPNAGDTAALVIPLSQQVEFSLLFDRTYEMGMGIGAMNGDLALMGCDVDVRAMRQFTGMYVGDYSQQGFAGAGALAGNAAVPTGVAGTVSQGTLMQLVEAYCYFGPAGAGIKYYGYVDSWDVTYTHFNTSMLPMRCEVDVSFTLLPLGVGGDTSTAVGAATAITQVAPVAGGAVGIIGGVGGR
jgi:hypothetical protein